MKNILEIEWKIVLITYQFKKIVFNIVYLDNSFGEVLLNKKLTNHMLDFSKIERLIFEVLPSIK